MTQPPIVALVAALAFAAPSSGCATTTTCPKPAEVPVPAAKVVTPPEITHVYRLDFVLAPGGAYTLEVEENRNGEVHVGSNVPLQVAPRAPSTPGAVPPVAFATPRVDVGLKLRAQVRGQGDDVVVHTNLDWSFADEASAGPAVIHKLVSSSDVAVALGKPALVQSIDDPQDKKRYQLTVTATKLR